jgi:N6-adenosine-specific RNA methylase IME4
MNAIHEDLLRCTAGERFATVLADPPGRFNNRTGKVAPEHRRLRRYETLSLGEIKALPVREILARTAHLYLWVPNALLPEGIAVMTVWGFTYKTNIVWYKIRKDSGPDGCGVGCYFRNVTAARQIAAREITAREKRTLAKQQHNQLGTPVSHHAQGDVTIHNAKEVPLARIIATATRISRCDRTQTEQSSYEEYEAERDRISAEARGAPC